MGSEFEFLLYQEAADRLGISIDSVRRQARRKGWPKKQGNDGKARVGIPIDRLQDGPQDSPPDSPQDTVPALLARIAELQAELAAAGAREAGQERLITALQEDRDAWRNHAKRPFWRRLVA
jgi:DNA-directed RNA polymerase specialized sigma24 family protein